MFADSSLWILPTSRHGTWFARVDWYLNWQLSKGLRHTLPAPSRELELLARENDVALERVRAGDMSPLLVSSKGLVPADKCVVLDYNEDLKDWINEAKTLAKNLKAAHLRVFLPAGISAAKAEAAWGKTSSESRAEFTEEPRE